MIELLTPAEMAEADRLDDRGRHAGHRPDGERPAARSPTPWRGVNPRGAPTVCVVAGPGNNGGDGFVARACWPSAAIRSGCCCWATAAGSRAMRRDAAARWHGPIEPAARRRRSRAPALIVDALFGAGLDRPVEGPARAMIEAINAAGAPVIAVDLPSGINGDDRRGDGRGGAGRPRRSRSSAASPATCCCRDGCIAGTSRSPTSAFPTTVLESIRPTHLRQRAGAVGGSLSGAAAGRPQISARPCRRGVGRSVAHRRGAARRARRAAGRRRSRHHRQPARCARGQRREPTLPSWFGRSTAPTSLPDGWPTAAQRRRARTGRRGRATRCGRWFWRRCRANARWCSMPTR